MNKYEVSTRMEGLGEQRQRWADARKEFDGNYERVLLRLVWEGLRAFMTAAEMGKALGRSTSQMRDFMRSHGITPSDSRTVLSDLATKALTENAEIMGIDPDKMDLTSPLAYLPMGKNLRTQFLETDAVKGVTEVEPDAEGYWCEACGFFEEGDLHMVGTGTGRVCEACGCSEDIHLHVKVVRA